MTDPQRRVAKFRNNFLPFSETFIHDELRHHIRYQSVVFARTRKNQAFFEAHHVEAVENMPNERNRMASLRYALTGYNKYFHSVFETLRFDIVHAHFGHNGLYALPYAEKYQLPLVVSLHGRDVTILCGRDKYRPLYWKYLLEYKKLFARTHLFLAASTELKTLIVSVGCPPEKVIVNRLGIDLDNFAPDEAQQSTDKPTILMVGRFVEKKGHKYAINAMAKVLRQGVPARLVLVGRGELLAKCQKLARSLGIAAHVEFLGGISHDKVRPLMQSASVVLAPSVVAKNLDRESGLIVAKEAGACGVPVVGTYHGGIPDIVADCETGFLVPERDSEALADRLCRLLGDEETRRRMGAAARKKMEAEYDIRKKMIRLEEIYDEAVMQAARRKQNGS